MRTPENTAPPVEKLFLVYVNTDETDDAYVEAELEGLVEAAGGEVAGSTRQRLDRPTNATFVGSGKVEEIAGAVAETQADVVVFDTELNGVQIRNLEEKLQRRVIDRTSLILDIFARRARTREGQLQVELAQLTYRLPRLMSIYTKFERQRGGIGMRGPGETQLESDRRMIRNRIAGLKQEIEEVKQHREQQRQSRARSPYPVVAIVGYTSAGKSTLMNRLVGTDLLADAMPFATLDPTTRKLDLPGGYAVYLTDTVGFIRNLPTPLVAAFRSTLEEVVFADVMLHVVDVGHPEWEVQRDSVLATVADLGAEGKPTVTAFNKIDTLDDPGFARRLVADWPSSAAISAKNGTGLDDLLHQLVKSVQEHLGRVQAVVPYDQQSLVEACYQNGRVLSAEYLEDGIHLEAELVPAMRARLGPYLVGSR